MERKFHQELEKLKQDLLGMASLVEQAIADSVKSLVKRNTDLAYRVIEGDQEIDTTEMKIEEQCLRLLALRQPMAVDLRFITSAMKITTDLERMGDQAVNIAHRAVMLNREPLLKPLIDIPRMAQLAQSMVKDSLDAFVNHNPDLALSVCQRDDEVDHLNDQVFRELLTFMLQDPSTVSRALQLIFFAHQLERIADHSTNIAESVIFMVKAQVIKHRVQQKKT
jgi:phosphate transport system protein